MATMAGRGPPEDAVDGEEVLIATDAQDTYSDEGTVALTDFGDAEEAPDLDLDVDEVIDLDALVEANSFTPASPNDHRAAIAFEEFFFRSIAHNEPENLLPVVQYFHIRALAKAGIIYVGDAPPPHIKYHFDQASLRPIQRTQLGDGNDNAYKWSFVPDNHRTADPHVNLALLFLYCQRLRADLERSPGIFPFRDAVSHFLPYQVVDGIKTEDLKGYYRIDDKGVKMASLRAGFNVRRWTMFAKAAKPGSQIDISSIERYVLVGADDAIRAYLSNESNQARREEAWNNLLAALDLRSTNEDGTLTSSASILEATAKEFFGQDYHHEEPMSYDNSLRTAVLEDHTLTPFLMDLVLCNELESALQGRKKRADGVAFHRGFQIYRADGYQEGESYAESYLGISKVDAADSDSEDDVDLISDPEEPHVTIKKSRKRKNKKKTKKLTEEAGALAPDIRQEQDTELTDKIIETALPEIDLVQPVASSKTSEPATVPGLACPILDENIVVENTRSKVEMAAELQQNVEATSDSQKNKTPPLNSNDHEQSSDVEHGAKLDPQGVAEDETCDLPKIVAEGSLNPRTEVLSKSVSVALASDNAKPVPSKGQKKRGRKGNATGKGQGSAKSASSHPTNATPTAVDFSSSPTPPVEAPVKKPVVQASVLPSSTTGQAPQPDKEEQWESIPAGIAGGTQDEWTVVSGKPKKPKTFGPQIAQNKPTVLTGLRQPNRAAHQHPQRPAAWKQLSTPRPSAQQSNARPNSQPKIGKAKATPQVLQKPAVTHLPTGSQKTKSITKADGPREKLLDGDSDFPLVPSQKTDVASPRASAGQSEKSTSQANRKGSASIVLSQDAPGVEATSKNMAADDQLFEDESTHKPDLDSGRKTFQIAESIPPASAPEAAVQEDPKASTSETTASTAEPTVPKAPIGPEVSTSTKPKPTNGPEASVPEALTPKVSTAESLQPMSASKPSSKSAEASIIQQASPKGFDSCLESAEPVSSTSSSQPMPDTEPGSEPPATSTVPLDTKGTPAPSPKATKKPFTLKATAAPFKPGHLKSPLVVRSPTSPSHLENPAIPKSNSSELPKKDLLDQHVCDKPAAKNRAVSDQDGNREKQTEEETREKQTDDADPLARERRNSVKFLRERTRSRAVSGTQVTNDGGPGINTMVAEAEETVPADDAVPHLASAENDGIPPHSPTPSEQFTYEYARDFISELKPTGPLSPVSMNQDGEGAQGKSDWLTRAIVPRHWSFSTLKKFRAEGHGSAPGPPRIRRSERKGRAPGPPRDSRSEHLSQASSSCGPYGEDDDAHGSAGNDELGSVAFDQEDVHPDIYGDEGASEPDRALSFDFDRQDEEVNTTDVERHGAHDLSDSPALSDQSHAYPSTAQGDQFTSPASGEIAPVVPDLDHSFSVRLGYDMGFRAGQIEASSEGSTIFHPSVLHHYGINLPFTNGWGLKDLAASNVANPEPFAFVLEGPDTITCTFCHSRYSGTPEKPVVLCSGCRLGSNIRYCSTACLLADSFGHSRHGLCQRSGGFAFTQQHPELAQCLCLRDPIVATYDESPQNSRQKAFSVFRGLGSRPNALFACRVREAHDSGTRHQMTLAEIADGDVSNADYYVFWSRSTSRPNAAEADSAIASFVNLPRDGGTKQALRRALRACFYSNRDKVVLEFLFRQIKHALLRTYDLNAEVMHEFLSQFQLEFGFNAATDQRAYSGDFDFEVEWPVVDARLTHMERQNNTLYSWVLWDSAALF